MEGQNRKNHRYSDIGTKMEIYIYIVVSDERYKDDDATKKKNLPIKLFNNLLWEKVIFVLDAHIRSEKIEPENKNEKKKIHT